MLQPIALAAELGGVIAHLESNGPQGFLVLAAIGVAAEQQFSLTDVIAASDRITARGDVQQLIAAGEAGSNQHTSRAEVARAEGDATTGSERLTFCEAEAAGGTGQGDGAAGEGDRAAVSGIGAAAATATGVDVGANRVTGAVSETQVKAHSATHRSTGDKTQKIGGGTRARFQQAGRCGADAGQGRPATAVVAGNLPIADVGAVHGVIQTYHSHTCCESSTIDDRNHLTPGPLTSLPCWWDQHQ